jgi:hypothetical protein
VVRVAQGVRIAAAIAVKDFDRAAELPVPEGDRPGLSRATESELVALLHQAGDKALAHGQALLARDVYTPARAIYRRMGDSSASAALTHALRSLPSTSARADESAGVRSRGPERGRRLLRRRDRNDD